MMQYFTSIMNVQAVKMLKHLRMSWNSVKKGKKEKKKGTVTSHLYKQKTSLRQHRLLRNLNIRSA